MAALIAHVGQVKFHSQFPTPAESADLAVVRDEQGQPLVRGAMKSGIAGS